MWSLSVASLGAMPPALHCIMQMHILSFSGRYALAELSDNHRTHLSQGIRGPSLHHGADVCRHKIYCMAPIHKVHYLCCEPATNPAKANLNHVKPCHSHLTLSMLNRFDAFQMRRCPAPTLSQIFGINLMKVLPTYVHALSEVYSQSSDALRRSFGDTVSSILVIKALQSTSCL